MILPTIKQPTKTCTLPDSKTPIKYRKFLHGEEKLLLIAKESGNDNEIELAVHDIITRCTEGTISDVSALSPVDIEYLFLQLRIDSKGESTTIGIKCKNHIDREELVHPVQGTIPAYSGACNKVNEVVIDLRKVEVNIPSDEDKLVKITDDVGMGMIFPTTKIVSEHGKIRSERDAMLLIYDCIDSIYHGDELFDVDDLEDKVAELDAFFDQFNNDQMKAVTEFFKKIPNLHMTVPYTCTSCGHEDVVTLRGLTDFF